MNLQLLASSSPAALLAFLDAQAVRYVVCSGLVALTCALLVLAGTRWGQSNPLRKCIVLSLVAHLLVGIYATTVQIVAGRPHGGDATSIVLLDDMAAESSGEDGAGDAAAGDVAPEAASPAGPSEASPGDPLEKPATVKPDAGDKIVPTPAAAEAAPDPPAPVPSPAKPAAPSQEKQSAAAAPGAKEHPDAAASHADPPAGAAAKPNPVASSQDVPPPDPGRASPPDPASNASPRGDAFRPPLASAAAGGASASVSKSSAAAAEAAKDPLAGPASAAKPTPEIYVLRTAGDHVRVAEKHGGSEQTEAAVGAALAYLVANQSIDGRWNPRALEAGRQTQLDGPDRQGVGQQADTGLTGLCLLALLAAGHTHLEGRYAVTVRHGLEYLLGAQSADGSLCGAATLYERMYCHGMAAFALSEALAMTGDDRLQPRVRAAVGYTLRAQRPFVGGWRYQPGEPGDMSQFGWQAMALKSAQLGGIAIPEESRAAMRQFLQSVSSGTHSGLAAYSPGRQPTRAMTAEALVCRQFMGLAADHPQSREAADFVIKELPGDGPANVYYWYYGTLATYQTQGVYWERWNAALQKQLLGSQRRDGKLAGSWDPDPIWGGHGGRAFSTALSTLCLEVYYRFLPLYAAHADTGRVTR